MTVNRTEIGLAPLCFFTAALTVVTIHSCWLLASWEGYVAWCNPYWSDCVSVSETGRNGSAYFVFKGGIIAACVFQGIVWQLSRYWLINQGGKNGALPVLGWSAAVALAIYSLSLGHAGDTFRMLRRLGVVLYIALSFFCFLSCAAGLIQTRMKTFGVAMLNYSLMTLAVAIVSLGLDALLGDDYNRIENAFEWWLLMLLNLQLFGLAWLWRRSQFSAALVSV